MVQVPRASQFQRPRASFGLRALVLVASVAAALCAAEKFGLTAFLAGHWRKLQVVTCTSEADLDRAGVRGVIVSPVSRQAAKKAAAKKKPIEDGDTVYIKMHTGLYIGELDGTSKKEWVKARGKKKDENHALTIEKKGGGTIESGDWIFLVMPLTVTNGTKIHLDCLGSAVRARYYDQRGQWQRIMIVKEEGGPIYSGDKIYLKGHQGEYIDGNPLEKASDGEVKCRWRDQGNWQLMTIEA